MSNTSTPLATDGGSEDLNAPRLDARPLDGAPGLDAGLTDAASSAERSDASVTQPSTAVWTNRNDNARTGLTLSETVLNTSNVLPARFGLLFTRAIEGQIYAQPLYVPNVVIPGRGTHDAVFVATEHNMVYAFDANDPAQAAPLWSVSLGAPVPTTEIEIGGNCANLTPEIGITSTPVIDLATGTLYVVAKTHEPVGYAQRLHALDLTTGRERAGSPVILAAQVPGTGGGTHDGVVAFDPFQQLNRPALALSNGVIYMAFASHCDHYPFHGWILAYDAAAMTLRAAYNTTPNGDNGGIWQSGTGLSVDARGDVYFSAGDGTTTLDSTPIQLAQSVGRLRLSGARLEVVDYFTPFDHLAMTEADLDLGSTAVLLMPGTNLAIVGSKQGMLYAINRDAMGHFHAGDDSQIPQSFLATHTRDTRNIHGTPAYWNSPAGPRVYLWGEDDVLKSFAFDGRRFIPTPSSVGAHHADSGMPGGILSISAHNSEAGTGIVWVNIPRQGDANEAIVDGVLRAYDASDLSHELWNSDMNPSDNSGLFAKFTPPTIANGRVYLATFSARLDVYGLR